MLLEALKVPFRWHENFDIGPVWKRTDCNSYRYKLITPYDRMIPFMHRFERDATVQLPTSWKIFNIIDGIETEVADCPLDQLEYYTFGDWDYLVYKGGSLGIDLETGFYYSVLVLGNYKSFISEEFWIDCVSSGRELEGNEFSEAFGDDYGPLNFTSGSLKKYTKLEWWNGIADDDCDLGNILYQTGYHNIIFIEAELIRDEPEILEEGFEDGNKNFVATFVKFTDKIRFDDLIPEYVLNALLLVKLHKNVVVTTRDDRYTTSAKDFQVKFTYSGPCLVLANCSFKQETELQRANCCANNEIVAYGEGGGGGGGGCTPVTVEGDLPEAFVGEPYFVEFAIGGTAPFTLGDITGLPDGLTAEIDGDTLRISGTPTTPADEVTVTIEVLNCDGEELFTYEDTIDVTEPEPTFNFHLSSSLGLTLETTGLDGSGAPALGPTGANAHANHTGINGDVEVEVVGSIGTTTSIEITIDNVQYDCQAVAVAGTYTFIAVVATAGQDVEINIINGTC